MRIIRYGVVFVDKNMNLIVFFSGFWLLLGIALGENITTENLTDSRSTITWKPIENSTIVVQVDDGYKIQVDITQLDVNGENKDYVKVNSLSDGDDEEESDALMFTYTVSGKPSYLYNNHKVKAKYVGSTDNNSVSIQFTRVGLPATTTTEPATTTTTEAMPTPSPEESHTYNVFLYGRNAETYGSEEVTKLRGAIAGMGAAYCHAQRCPLNGTITSNNAKIELLTKCPVIWENYKNCVNLTFALPIVKLADYNENDPWVGYQLNEPHLKVMWDTYGEQYIKDIGLSVYNEPDISGMTTIRLIIIFSVIVGLITLILALKYVVGRISKRRRKISDTFSIIGQPSNRNSQMSLTPHYLQELPPLFSNDFPLYADQVPHKSITDFRAGFTEKNDPFMASNKLNISRNDFDEVEDADA